MAYHLAQPDFLSRRALTVAGILALHVLAAYVLATGMLHGVLRDDGPALIPTFTTDTQPVRPPPLPSEVTLSGKPHLQDLPPAQVYVPDAVPAHPEAATPPSLDAAGSGSAAPPAPQPLQVIGRNQLPDTQEYYPPGLIREGIEGASLVRVCVDAQGVRRTDPSIEASSGNAQLDASALNVARHGRYARAVQGGAPVPNCYQFRINFRIRH